MGQINTLDEPYQPLGTITADEFELARSASNHSPNDYAQRQRADTMKLRQAEASQPLGDHAVARAFLDIINGDEALALLKTRGACNGLGPDIFYPETKSIKIGKEPKEICDICTVRIECLEYALSNHENFGIWGGTSEKTRREIWKAESAELAAARTTNK